jgi:hypothetical protein
MLNAGADHSGAALSGLRGPQQGSKLLLNLCQVGQGVLDTLQLHVHQVGDM